MSTEWFGHVCGERFQSLAAFQLHARKCARMAPVRTSSREARADDEDESLRPDSDG